MPDVTALFHRTKTVSIFPLEGDRSAIEGDRSAIDGDRFLIEAVLQDEVHDVHVEVEILHPSLEIVAARSEVRNGPFTAVCNLTHANMAGLVGMKVARGFTQAARAVVGGVGGCHRVSELLVEVGQAAYQLHFVRYFGSLPPEVRDAPDDPPARRRAVLGAVPGMRNTCFSYRDESAALIAERATPLRLRPQAMPSRKLP